MERIAVSQDVLAALDEAQRRVMTNVLAEEESRREHVVVLLSGAHAYGFPSPDSDLDLKAIHVARTEDLLGLEAPPPTVDRAEFIDGVEIDYTSNELAHALFGILAGNGNFIERVLGRMIAHESPLLAQLRPIVRGALSRRVHRHYRGFALNQRRFLEKEPTTKKLLYVLRTTLTGIHLLATGELDADLTRLMARYDLSEAQALVEHKRSGERVGVDMALLDAWQPRIDTLFQKLDTVRDTSPLPEEPSNTEEIRSWLLRVRKEQFSG
ncbi:nucleotidyltransferase domain-containing protein [Pendulispora rubella]|uniref:Nucleotidyltransferase domain-containing protein n=1 Tax=Pendulispora rubella TaxID=2741070 RepID=A0ABZ2KSJ8_9BACT